MRFIRPYLLALMVLGALASGASALGVGEPAPDFTLTDMDGVSHTLSDYQGKVVFLNIMGYS